MDSAQALVRPIAGPPHENPGVCIEKDAFAYIFLREGVRVEAGKAKRSKIKLNMLLIMVIVTGFSSDGQQ